MPHVLVTPCLLVTQLTSLLSPEWAGTLGQILQRTGALSKLNEIQQVDLFFVNNVHGISLTEVTATASSTGWEGRWNFESNEALCRI